MKKIAKLNNVFSTLLYLLLISNINAQLQNSYWYFGDQAGLNFNDGTQPTTTLTNSMMATDGGSASVSDLAGNLLFYTNGINIWDNTHQIMPNGSGLLGSTDVSQSTIIVPDPNNVLKYYVFSNQGNEMGLSGLYYSIVNMGLNEGQGDVDITQKNIQLLGSASEKLTSVINLNDDTYWVISFAPSSDPDVNDTFYSFKIDATGISLFNQSTFTFNFTDNSTKKYGQMKISPDGQSLAMTHNVVDLDVDDNIVDNKNIFTFDFDSATGIVSSMNDSYVLFDALYTYGLEFSPDSNLLYVTVTNSLNGREIGEIHQIDYRSQMGGNPFLIYDDRNAFFGLQLGIDGKIYMVNSSGNLSTIDNPNVFGSGANYNHENINFNGLTFRELPQFVPNTHLFIIVKNEQKNQNPLIHGNPFKEELKIKFDYIQSYNIELYNYAGILVKTVIYDNMINKKVYKIDTSDLQVGTYYLIIKGEKSQIWHKKVLKIG